MRVHLQAEDLKDRQAGAFHTKVGTSSEDTEMLSAVPMQQCDRD